MVEVRVRGEVGDELTYYIIASGNIGRAVAVSTNKQL